MTVLARRTLVLEPHQDDAVLFACFTLLRYDPRVVTVLAAARLQPGVTWQQRDAENVQAARVLGLSPAAFSSWPYPDVDPPWDAIVADLEEMDDEYELVFAPWPEPGGNGQHNRIGELALEVFGRERVRFYTTYVTGGPRTQAGEIVNPRPEWIIRKHQALACYTSQILKGPRRFFMHALDEWIVTP